MVLMVEETLTLVWWAINVPEVVYDNIIKTHGMNISITTSAKWCWSISDY